MKFFYTSLMSLSLVCSCSKVENHAETKDVEVIGANGKLDQLQMGERDVPSSLDLGEGTKFFFRGAPYKKGRFLISTPGKIVEVVPVVKFGNRTLTGSQVTASMIDTQFLGSGSEEVCISLPVTLDDGYEFKELMFMGELTGFKSYGGSALDGLDISRAYGMAGSTKLDFSANPPTITFDWNQARGKNSYVNIPLKSEQVFLTKFGFGFVTFQSGTGIGVGELFNTSEKNCLNKVGGGGHGFIREVGNLKLYTPETAADHQNQLKNIDMELQRWEAINVKSWVASFGDSDCVHKRL